MTSKYDQFWEDRAAEISNLIESAANGRPSEINVTEIQLLGDRKSWFGKARVSGSRVLDAPMAHMMALARLVTESGECEKWEGHEFDLKVSSACVLRVEMPSQNAIASGPIPPIQNPQPSGVPKENPPFISVEPSTAPAACHDLHKILSELPLYKSPQDLQFTDGLYFFYEDGESTEHDSGNRVVRVGNHPRKDGRLIRRLKEHYRGTKNGSVFRRYMGGALIRRQNPNSSCLEPSPGKGHWEKQGSKTCPNFGHVEQQVSSYVSDKMQFRCVYIPDREERNRFEEMLIATLAGCENCRPSENWLGGFAYGDRVRESGLWNNEFVGGETMNQEDVRRLSLLAANSPKSPSENDLSDTLLLIPCSGGKKGAPDPELPNRAVGDFLSSDIYSILDEGRSLAFKRTSVDLESPLSPALAWYTGQPYANSAFRNQLINAMANGLHCLIVSGGYGLLRPEEPIHFYKAHLSKTKTVWKYRVPQILEDYIRRNKIRRTFSSFSKGYADVVPLQLGEENWRAVAQFDSSIDQGAALQVVPKKVGNLLSSLLSSNFVPGEGWDRF